jgi:dTDP-3-amino-3,4,6-trideoxy-alpha-D-glucose transaminase
MAESGTIPLLDLAGQHAEVQEELDAAWRSVLARGTFIAGQECAGFEAEWASYCGTTTAVGVGNGLDALRLALLALGVGPGDEVIVPGHTFIATWLAVDAVGAVVVPVDVGADHPQIDPAAVAAAVGPRTAAVIAVHLYGSPAPMRELRALADRHGLALVEDAAQAHGAALHGVRAGAMADVAAFSFYPGKNLGALGDGGAVTTSDTALADRVRSLGNYGSRTKYQHDERGGNSRLDELQAAFLRVKLRRLDGWTARRREVASTYDRHLGAVPGVRSVQHLPTAEPVHHLQVVRVEERDRVLRELERRGIGAGVHYPVPPHRSPAYAGTAAAGAELPCSEAWSREVLSLPMGPTVTPTQVERICTALRDAVVH